jgi:signal peptidase II
MTDMHHGRLRIRVAVFACVALVALALDQGTKAWAQSNLGDGRSIEVIPHVLSLTLIHNPGASLGLGSSRTWLISLLAAAACIMLVVLAIRTDSMRWTVAFALAFAGAAGNLYDRIAYADGFLNGKVVDFLNYGWSIGNVADIVLMVAGVFIVVLILRGVPFGKHALNGRVPVGADPAAAQGIQGSGKVQDLRESQGSQVSQGSEHSQQVDAEHDGGALEA